MPIDPYTGEEIGDLPRLTVRPNPLPVEAYDAATGMAYPDQPVQDYSAVNPAIARLLGVGEGERFQTWPERMARSGFSLPADVYSGAVPIETEAATPYAIAPGSNDTIMEPRSIPKALGMGNFTVPNAESAIARVQDTSGMAGMSTLPGVALAGGIAKDALGIVPVARAKQLKVNKAQPDDLLKSIVDNTPAATLDPDGALRINVKRGQLEDQEMAESVRGGVFYLPAGDKNFRHYKGRVDDNTGRAVNNYGGSQIVEGETAYLNPLIVKGATGGKAPEMAYTQLKGKDAFKQLEKEVRDISTSNIYNNKNHNVQLELVQRFLEKNAPELMNHADYILENSNKGNQLRYALQEAAIASAARQAGHDGIIGYSVGRGQNTGKPFISEIFDVRENRYPSPSGEYSMHPQFLEDSKAATGIGAVNQSGYYSTLERTIANSKVQKGTPEQWQAYLKNQPGIKPEELEFSLSNLPNKQLTKAELEAHVAENGIKLGEVWKGNSNQTALFDRQVEIKNRLEKIQDEFDNLYGQPDSAALAKKRQDLANEQSSLRKEHGEIFNKLEGDVNNKPKFSSYQLPNGSNYRELLLTVPEKPIQLVGEGRNRRAVPDPSEVRYQSSHWDEPNVLAHIRMNDRFIPDPNGPSTNPYNTLPRRIGEIKPDEKGLKTLHIEEIQSDWHQAGRKQGYKGDAVKLKPEVDKIIAEKLEPNKDFLPTNLVDPNTKTINPKNFSEHQLGFWQNQKVLTADEVNTIKNYQKSLSGTPDAPFKKTWDELALKRAITEAAHNGYDAVSWTPGEAQAARYDLSKHIDNLQFIHNRDGAGDLTGFKNGSPILVHRINKPEELTAVIGKEAAEKLMSKEADKGNGVRKLENADLKVGGEGMKAFYDTMLPAKANALIKKMGGKVEYEYIQNKDKTWPYSITVESDGKNYWLHGMDPRLDGKKTKLSENFKSFIEADDLREKMYKGFTERVPIIRITPQMREKITKEGFPLYSSGVPNFTPVDDPFKKKEPKLVPIDYNPWTNRNAT